jgi:hypothetical protein
VYFAWFLRRAARDVKEQERQERLAKERLEGRQAASFAPPRA